MESGFQEKPYKPYLLNLIEEDASDKKGDGIGLATCKRIIKEYSGILNVTSIINKGTSFECLLKDRRDSK
jgi:signal transduction histidine kinase